MFKRVLDTSLYILYFWYIAAWRVYVFRVFWSVFSRIRTPYLSLFSPNARKYGPEKLRIRTFFTQRIFYNMMNPVRYNTRTQFDCYITFLQYSAAGFAKWSKYPQLWFCIKNFNLRKYWDKPFSIQLWGITENYITQHCWILTYYNPLIRTRIYAFRGVTVC